MFIQCDSRWIFMVVKYSCKDINAAFVNMVVYLVDVDAVWCVFLIAVNDPKESLAVVLEFIPYRYWCRCEKQCRVMLRFFFQNQSSNWIYLVSNLVKKRKIGWETFFCLSSVGFVENKSKMIQVTSSNPGG